MNWVVMMLKQNIYLIIIVLLGSIFLLGASRYAFDLSQYHEECYEYKQIPTLKNWSYQDYKDGNLCYQWTYFKPNCTLVTKYFYYNSTIDGNCSKYMLVRETS